MAVDRIAYPLPVIVNGYACLNGPEIELAKQHVDPARPNAPAEPSQAQRPDTPRDNAGRYDAARADAARQDAVARSAQVVGYSADAPRTAAIPTGQVMSVEA